MLGGNAVVVPEPGEWDDVGLPKEKHGDVPQYPLTTSKLYVTITFGQNPDARGSVQREWGSICSRTDDVKPDDLYVRRYYGFCSTFVHRSDGGLVDYAMEEKFSRSKYKHFRGAFMQASFVMPILALVLAFQSMLEQSWVRAGILTGVVAPLYLIYGTFAWKHQTKYLKASGTTSERLLLGLLCLQSIAIVWAEWARPKVDYGMMVMHNGFVHNYTPLSEVAMHTVTAGFGLLPYILLKVLLFLDPKIALTDAKMAPVANDMCVTTTGEMALLLQIFMPFIILLYQVFSTMKRDKSFRINELSGEQLRAKRKQLNVEKQKCEDLLMSMLPRQIITSLKANEPIEPQLFNDVTVIFVEICDFSRLCVHLQPSVVVDVLNIIYLEFDRLSDMLHVYKVETVAQVYMAVVGCPEPIINHADVAAHFAIAAQKSLTHLRERIANIKVPSQQASPLLEDLDTNSGEFKLIKTPAEITTKTAPCITARGGVDAAMINIRVGLNSGTIRAGVVGLDSPRYKLVGDTVNTASRMESTCEPGKVQVSSMTKERLTKAMFLLEDRGEVPVKGKGTMRTFFLNGYVESCEQEPRTVLIEQGCVGGPFQDDTGANSGTLAVTAKTSCTVNRVSSSISDTFEKDSGWFALDTSATWWRAAINRIHILDSGEGGDTNNRESSNAIKSTSSGGRLCTYSQLQMLFLNVTPSVMYTLKLDKPKFDEDTLHKRISSARNLTIMWLLILAVVSVIDYFMDVLNEEVNEDLPRYRRAILFRAVGNNVIGLIYLLALTSKDLFRKYAQRLTVGMLVAQGVALLACGRLIYNSEPAIVAMFGAYVLFYTVCTIGQRLTLCALAVVGYVLIELERCDFTGLVGAANNIVFQLVFFVFISSSIRLEEHLEHLAHYEHRRVTSKLKEIEQAKAASSQLLYNLLPAHVVELVGEGVSPIAEHHPRVTIIFTDIKGFTLYSSRITPQELVDLLNSMYSAFDEIIVNWALHKVEVIGDAYFVSAGCPAPSCAEDGADAHEYAMRAVEVALAMLRTLPRVCDDASVQMRVGLHTGSVVAGVVGKKGPRYHLFGSAVGYAEKMESHGIPGRVQISDATHTLLTEGGHDYEYEERTVEVEGEDGHQRTWLVNKSNSKAAFQIQKQLMVQRRQCVHQARSLS